MSGWTHLVFNTNILAHGHHLHVLATPCTSKNYGTNVSYSTTCVPLYLTTHARSFASLCSFQVSIIKKTLILRPEIPTSETRLSWNEDVLPTAESEEGVECVVSRLPSVVCPQLSDRHVSRSSNPETHRTFRTVGQFWLFRGPLPLHTPPSKLSLSLSCLQSSRPTPSV